MTPSSSARYWFVLCAVHDTRNIFPWQLFSNALRRFVMFLSTFHIHMWQLEIDTLVSRIRKLILLYIAEKHAKKVACCRSSAH